jgi:hypothetical protein
MSRTRFATTSIAVALLASALTGCVPSATLPSGTLPDEVPVEDCLIGSWLLDLDDYAAQSQAWVVDLGIPMESLTYSGTYRIELTDNGDDLLFTAIAQLTTSAVVHGTPISGSESWFGESAFTWADESHESITLDDWGYTEDLNIEGDIPGVGVLYPEEAGTITMACSGDTMSLSGPGAPLVGLFVRQR